ncbi:MAG: type II toxin-antitoxin system prevent-host-death family antitoxin [Elusimicrobia bacterium]|nr:type II toxin-antitoxin system prevent-host-death family antitoxin [Elusimicrobiota bacterium]
MKVYSIARLKDGLSSIVAEVAKGAEVVVTDHNRPVARIVPISRVPPLPAGDLSRLREAKPLRLGRRAKLSSAQLVRRIRDEE